MIIDSILDFSTLKGLYTLPCTSPYLIELSPRRSIINIFYMEEQEDFVHVLEGRETLHFCQGENWLRLVVSAGGLDLLADTQDALRRDGVPNPSIISLEEVGKFSPTDDCYICIDVDGKAIAIKDMRSISDGGGDTFVVCLQKRHEVLGDDVDSDDDASNDDVYDKLEELPRRQMRLLKSGDRVCTLTTKPRLADESTQEERSGNLGLVLTYRLYRASKYSNTQVSQLSTTSAAAAAPRVIARVTIAMNTQDSQQTMTDKTDSQPPHSIETALQPGTQDLDDSDGFEDDDVDFDDDGEQTQQFPLATQEEEEIRQDTTKEQQQQGEPLPSDQDKNDSDNDDQQDESPAESVEQGEIVNDQQREEPSTAEEPLTENESDEQDGKPYKSSHERPEDKFSATNLDDGPAPTDEIPREKGSDEQVEKPSTNTHQDPEETPSAANQNDDEDEIMTEEQDVKASQENATEEEEVEEKKEDDPHTSNHERPDDKCSTPNLDDGSVPTEDIPREKGSEERIEKPSTNTHQDPEETPSAANQNDDEDEIMTEEQTVKASQENATEEEEVEEKKEDDGGNKISQSTIRKEPPSGADVAGNGADDKGVQEDETPLCVDEAGNDDQFPADDDDDETVLDDQEEMASSLNTGLLDEPTQPLPSSYVDEAGTVVDRVPLEMESKKQLPTPGEDLEKQTAKGSDGAMEVDPPANDEISESTALTEVNEEKVHRKADDTGTIEEAKTKDDEEALEDPELLGVSPFSPMSQLARGRALLQQTCLLEQKRTNGGAKDDLDPGNRQPSTPKDGASDAHKTSQSVNVTPVARRARRTKISTPPERDVPMQDEAPSSRRSSRKRKAQSLSPDAQPEVRKLRSSPQATPKDEGVQESQLSTNSIGSRKRQRNESQGIQVLVTGVKTTAKHRSVSFWYIRDVLPSTSNASLSRKSKPLVELFLKVRKTRLKQLM